MSFCAHSGAKGDGSPGQRNNVSDGGAWGTQGPSGVPGELTSGSEGKVEEEKCRSGGVTSYLKGPDVSSDLLPTGFSWLPQAWLEIRKEGGKKASGQLVPVSLLFSPFLFSEVLGPVGS